MTVPEAAVKSKGSNMDSIRNLTILYVEDDAFAREEMAHFLKKRAGRVITARDGAEGIEMYELHKPDIIIADLLMPVMDGMEMLRRIREKHSNAHAIIVTSVDKVETVIEAIDLGIDGYIVKPLDFAELELKLAKIGDVILAGQRGRSGVFDDMEKRGETEDLIKKEFIKILKAFTGKGPRETVVQLIGNKVKITAFGALTQMEESLLRRQKNFEIVKHIRMVAYESLADQVAQMVRKHVSAAAGNTAGKQADDISGPKILSGGAAGSDSQAGTSSDMKIKVTEININLKKAMEQIVLTLTQISSNDNILSSGGKNQND